MKNVKLILIASTIILNIHSIDHEPEKQPDKPDTFSFIAGTVAGVTATVLALRRGRCARPLSRALQTQFTPSKPATRVEDVFTPRSKLNPILEKQLEEQQAFIDSSDPFTLKEFKQTLKDVDYNIFTIKIFGWTGMISPDRFDRLPEDWNKLQKKLTLVGKRLNKAEQDLEGLKKRLEHKKTDNSSKLIDLGNPVANVAVNVALFPWMLLLEDTVKNLSRKIEQKENDIHHLKGAQGFLHNKIETISTILKNQN